MTAFDSLNLSGASLKMTSVQVVETSVTVTNSSLKLYSPEQ